MREDHVIEGISLSQKFFRSEELQKEQIQSKQHFKKMLRLERMNQKKNYFLQNHVTTNKYKNVDL